MSRWIQTCNPRSRRVIGSRSRCRTAAPRRAGSPWWAKSPRVPSNSSGGSDSGPTVPVQIRPTDPKATGSLDQALVEVAITDRTVHDVLAVPVYRAAGARRWRLFGGGGRRRRHAPPGAGQAGLVRRRGGHGAGVRVRVGGRAASGGARRVSGSRDAHRVGGRPGEQDLSQCAAGDRAARREPDRDERGSWWRWWARRDRARPRCCT